MSDAEDISRLSQLLDSAKGAVKSGPPGWVVALALGLPVAYAGLRGIRHDDNVLRRYEEAERQGSTPMTHDTFRKFSARRERSSREKTANSPRAALTAPLAALGDLAQGLLMKKRDVTPEVMGLARKNFDPLGVDDEIWDAAKIPRAEFLNASPKDQQAISNQLWERLGEGARNPHIESAKNQFDDVKHRLIPTGQKGPDGEDILAPQFFQREFSPLRALGAGALGVGGLTALDVAAEPVEQSLQETMFPEYAASLRRSRLKEQLMGEGGKQIAQMLGDVVKGVGTEGYQAARAIPMGSKQQQMFTTAIQTDPMLSSASKAERDSLARAFNSMIRFAPELATDEFAVKNFLREALMSASGGPDYSTLSNLSRASQTIQGN